MGRFLVTTSRMATGPIGFKCDKKKEKLPCMVTHIATVWINRVRLPILHVVS